MAGQVIRVGGRDYTVRFPDLVRPLTPDEFGRMRESIRQRGVDDPVLVDEDDGIIDGINRMTIASELGLDRVPTRLAKPGLTLDQKRELAADLNAIRRHMSEGDLGTLAEQMQKKKREAVGMRLNGSTLQETAEATGFSPNTVKAAVESVLQVCKTDSTNTTVPNIVDTKADAPSMPAKVKGRDGKMYPARKPRKPKGDGKPKPGGKKGGKKPGPKALAVGEIPEVRQALREIWTLSKAAMTAATSTSSVGWKKSEQVAFLNRMFLILEKLRS